MKLHITLLLIALSAVGTRSLAATTCSTPLTQQAAVSLQTKLLDAMAHEDKTAFDGLTTDNLVLYERGEIYTRDSLFGIATHAHRAGVTIVWHVTQPRVTSDCHVAVMSYVDSGSIQHRGQAAVPIRWLETSSFRRDGGNWRVFLLTSERVAGMENAGAFAGSVRANGSVSSNGTGR